MCSYCSSIYLITMTISLILSQDDSLFLQPMLKTFPLQHVQLVLVAFDVSADLCGCHQYVKLL